MNTKLNKRFAALFFVAVIVLVALLVMIQPTFAQTARVLDLHSTNLIPHAIWSDGTTIWVTHRTTPILDSRLLAYDLDNGDRQAGNEIDLEGAGNGKPVGLWSDGATFWVSDYDDAMIYAYDLTTGDRRAGSDINTLGDAGNYHPRGIWSNGTTIWVADHADKKIYAYDLTTGDRQADRDINNLARPDENILGDAGNYMPFGLWSDGITMWVSDHGNDKIYAYELSTGTRQPDLDFNDIRSFSPDGLWSDGSTMWVVDDHQFKVFPHNMPATAALRSLELDVVDIGFSISRFDYARRVTSTTTVATVAAAAAASDSTVTITPADADSDTEGHQVDLSSGDNTITVVATNGDDTRTYIVTVTRTNFTALSDDDTLSALELEGIDMGTFDSANSHYTIGVSSSVAGTTVTTTPADQNAAVTVSPEDIDSNTEGHQVDISEGANTVTVAVESSDGTAERTYIIDVNRASDATYGWNSLKDINTPEEFDDRGAQGIWSDGATIWVSNADRWGSFGYTESKIFAYDLTTGARKSDKDLNRLDNWDNENPSGLWSDGTTMWVSDRFRTKIFAYDLATGARKSDQDIIDSSDTVWFLSEDLWSDGSTIWVAGFFGIFAYDLANGTRKSDKDIDIDIDNQSPTGLWSDGATMWVADSSDDKIYAYDLATGSREPDIEFDTLVNAGNHSPKGMWSNGEIMWVADREADKVFAYNMPETAVLSSFEMSGITIDFEPDVLDYTVSVPTTTTTTTVLAEALLSAADIDVSPSDADGDTEYHEVNLDVGDTEIIVTVTVGTRSSMYTVTVTRGNNPATGSADASAARPRWGRRWRRIPRTLGTLTG